MIFSMWGPKDSHLPDTTVEGTEQPHFANGVPLEATDRLFLVFEAPDAETAFRFHDKVQNTGSLAVVEPGTTKTQVVAEEILMGGTTKEFCTCPPHSVCGMKKLHPTEHHSILIGRPLVDYCRYCGKEAKKPE